MAANVEIKARTSNSKEIETLLESRTATEPVTLQQEDTFFSVPKGRLKMRCDPLGHCELIYYHRANEKGPVLSRYFRKEIKDPETTKNHLRELFGIKNVIRKSRKLFALDNVRIHLDEVEGLGRFVEIEVLVGKDCDEVRARYKAKQMMDELRITELDLVDRAYEDLAEDNRHQ